MINCYDKRCQYYITELSHFLSLILNRIERSNDAWMSITQIRFLLSVNACAKPKFEFYIQIKFSFIFNNTRTIKQFLRLGKITKPTRPLKYLMINILRCGHRSSFWDIQILKSKARGIRSDLWNIFEKLLRMRIFRKFNEIWNLESCIWFLRSSCEYVEFAVSMNQDR